MKKHILAITACMVAALPAFAGQQRVTVQEVNCTNDMMICTITSTTGDLSDIRVDPGSHPPHWIVTILPDRTIFTNGFEQP